MNENPWENPLDTIDNVWQAEPVFEDNQIIEDNPSGFVVRDELLSDDAISEENERSEIEVGKGSVKSSVWNNHESYPDTCKENEQKEEQMAIIEEAKNHSGSNDGDDFDDDFGAFEEISTEKLEFNDEVETLLNSLIPTKSMKPIPEEEINKAVFLIEGGVRPMKCYNTITSVDRQYLSDKIPKFNTTTRGCVEVSAWFKEMTKLSNEWISDEKGITSESNDEMKGLWKGAGKLNVFKWSTKIDGEKEEERTDSMNSIERKRIGDKLLSASYKEANFIRAKRIEHERLEKLQTDRLRIEREKRLLAEKQKREEEKLKYSQQQTDDSAARRKKKLFGGLFKGKSKISKDHISHDKVISVEPEDGSVSKELSLKEQMELEGYNLDGSIKKKKKGKYIGRRKTRTNDGDDGDNIDDDDDDDDNDGDYAAGEVNDFTAGGYNIIGESEVNDEIEPADMLAADDAVGTTIIQPEVEVRIPVKSTVVEDVESEDEFGSFAVVNPEHIEPDEAIVTEYFGNSPKPDSNTSANEDSRKPQNVINLIDL